MDEPLDVVKVIKNTQQIIDRCQNMPNVINLAGQLIVAEELRRLTAAVESFKSAFVQSQRG